jgi:hypothetical protein
MGAAPDGIGNISIEHSRARSLNLVIVGSATGEG